MQRFNFSKTFATKMREQRLLSLVWTSICAHNKDFQLFTIGEELDILITNFLRENLKISNEISRKLTSNVIPEDKFKWIKDSRRQFHWIIKYIKSSENFVDHRILIPIHLPPKEQSIAYFDYWSSIKFSCMPDAIDFLNKMRNDWEIHIKMDRHFEWLSKDKKVEKIEFFWNWLRLNNHVNIGLLNQFIDLEDVLTYFDSINASSHFIILTNQNARRIWNQRQRRIQAKDKKQCNFLLEKATITNLDEIAKYHRVSRTEAIEILINAEHKNRTYEKQFRLTNQSSQAKDIPSVPTRNTM